MEYVSNNEIIKDLEEHYINKGDRVLIKNTLDLINRQKAEIERLKKFLDMSRKVSLARRDSNLKICELNSKLIKELKTAKSKAINEFAERVEYFALHEDPEINAIKCKDYESYMGGFNQFRLQIAKGIDKLVKEMTE